MGLRNRILASMYCFMLCNIVNASFDLTESIYNFSLATFKIVDKNEVNIIMSPAAYQVILALAYEGASDSTAHALYAGLDIDGLTKQQVTNTFSYLMYKQFDLSGIATLKIANKIYINDIFQINPDFKAVASDFNTSVSTIDFRNNINAANEINAWASQETNGHIDGVVTANDFNCATSAVLINALYFNCKWKYQFDPSQTGKSIFYLNSLTGQEIDMMNIQGTFNYGSIGGLNTEVLQMEYADTSLSMLFLLHFAQGGLTYLKDDLSTVHINTIFESMKPLQVRVQIPKFKLKINTEFSGALKELGMGIIFDSHNADFKNIATATSQSNNLFVSSVKQQAFIEVNEAGAMAAPVAAANMLSLASNSYISSSPVVQTFVVDHPFMIMLLKGRDILYVGSFVQGDGIIIPADGNNVWSYRTNYIHYLPSA